MLGFLRNTETRVEIGLVAGAQSGPMRNFDCIELSLNSFRMQWFARGAFSDREM